MANVKQMKTGRRWFLNLTYILKGLPSKVPFLAQSTDFDRGTNQEQPNSVDYSETSVSTYQTAVA